MKTVILRKNGSKVKLLKLCKSEDLVVMVIGAIKAAREHLVSDKNLSEEYANTIIKELIYEELKIK